MPTRNITRSAPWILALLLASVSPTLAEETVLDRVVDVDVAAQPLSDALLELSRETGALIVMSAVEVGGRQAPGVQGTMTIRDALERMLTGSVLAAHVAGPNTIGVGTAPSSLEGVPREVESATTPAGEPAEPTAPTALQRERVIEEIVVTAQKREQGIRDVPISIAVLDQEFLIEANVTDFSSISKLVASTDIRQNQFPPDVRIRGFGSAQSNLAFEESVGIAIDEAAYNRLELFESAMFDVARVEVLRGPQGTLFGKNTTAGMLNVVLNEPGEELTGTLAIELNDLDRRRFEGAVGGPLIENFLNFRIAGLLDEENGILENTAHGHVAGARERIGDIARHAWRAKVELPDVAGARVLVTQESSLTEFGGVAGELAGLPPGEEGFYRQIDPDFDNVPRNGKASSDSPDPKISTREVDRLVARLHYDLAGWALDAVAGDSRTGFRWGIDADFSPARWAFTDFDMATNQKSLELRVATPTLPGLLGMANFMGFSLGSSDLTLGLYGQRQTFDERADIFVDVALLGAATASAQSPTPPPVPPSAGLEQTRMVFGQEATSLAGFAQLNWQLADRWALESGFRFTRESKDGDWVRTSDPGLEALGLSTFEAQRSRSGFTPKIALRYDLTDDVNVFGTWGTGFKSGGFNENAQNDDPRGLEYETERMSSWEAGSKMRLLGGAATLNAQLFWMTATDLQVYSIVQEGVDIGQNTVENAGKGRSRGAELEGTWLPTDWLTVRGFVGFDDTKFLEFLFGSCASDVEDTDGDGDPRCDLTGRPFANTPKWKAALSNRVRVPWASLPGFRSFEFVSPGTDWVGGLSVFYEGEQFRDRSLDPRTLEPAFWKLDVDLGIGNLAQGWSFRIGVENLTDERTIHSTLFDLAGSGFTTEFPARPRVVYGGARWSF